MRFYFLDIAREHEASGVPVSPFVRNAILVFESHPLRSLMESLDTYNHTVWNETGGETVQRAIKYTIHDQDAINVGRRTRVELSAAGLLNVTTFREEILMTVTEEEFVPKMLELLEQRML